MSNNNQKKGKISVANLVGIIVLFIVLAFDLLLFLAEDAGESDVMIDMTTTDYNFKDWQNDGFEGKAIAYFRVTCPNTVTKYSANSTVLSIYPGLEGYGLSTWIVEKNGNICICNWDWMDFDWLCENKAGTKLYVGTFELCDKEVPGYDAYFNITDAKEIAESDLERADFNNSFEVKTEESKEEMVTETSETDAPTSTEVEAENSSYETETSTVNLKWYCTDKWFYNAETGSWLEVIYYDDGSLEFAVDGLTVIYYSATGMYGDSYTVSGTSIEYVCNSSNGGTRVCYDSAFVPSITISGSAGYDGNYFLQQ